MPSLAMLRRMLEITDKCQWPFQIPPYPNSGGMTGTLREPQLAGRCRLTLDPPPIALPSLA